MTFTTKPLTAATWPDLEAVFNARGCSVARACWCMFYRKTGSTEWGTAEYAKIKEKNRKQLKALADGGEQVGLVGYEDGVPCGWISFGPREDFARLANSTIMKPVDDKPVWSVICFVVPSEFRKQGVARRLLDAAVAFCRKKKVKLLEGYPVDKPGRAADSSMWFGAKSMFDDAGFQEIARRKSTRPVVRLKVV
ncbi:GNAT family N-acetyltransferase [Ramlibacter sp. PS4R-6]|uniref:GNAT family N-acetyltransferase n=1 Tax=Ramlibacter sp. PS4R-6 TaxID=3133438 RepID=UPI0030A98B12